MEPQNVAYRLRIGAQDRSKPFHDEILIQSGDGLLPETNDRASWNLAGPLCGNLGELLELTENVNKDVSDLHAGIGAWKGAEVASLEEGKEQLNGCSVIGVAA